MADYTRIRGSKEKIGIVLSTTDSSNFVVETATVDITHQYLNAGKYITASDLEKGACSIDNQTPQKSHRVEYLWECKSGGSTRTAIFSAKLPTGEVIVRSVTIDVR